MSIVKWSGDVLQRDDFEYLGLGHEKVYRHPLQGVGFCPSCMVISPRV